MCVARVQANSVYPRMPRGMQRTTFFSSIDASNVIRSVDSLRFSHSTVYLAVCTAHRLNVSRRRHTLESNTICWCRCLSLLDRRGYFILVAFVLFAQLKK